MKVIRCVSCHAEITEKNTIGINRKLLGEDIKNFYCMDCLAEYLECDIQDIIDKIEEFKEAGCKHFS